MPTTQIGATPAVFCPPPLCKIAVLCEVWKGREREKKKREREGGEGERERGGGGGGERDNTAAAAFLKISL